AFEGQDEAELPGALGALQIARDTHLSEILRVRLDQLLYQGDLRHVRRAVAVDATERPFDGVHPAIAHQIEVRLRQRQQLRCRRGGVAVENEGAMVKRSRRRTHAARRLSARATPRSKRSGGGGTAYSRGELPSVHVRC